MQAQTATRKVGFRLVELVAERRDGTRSVRGTLRRQSNAQIRLGNFHIGRAG
jgi:hypothetical protein